MSGTHVCDTKLNNPLQFRLSGITEIGFFMPKSMTEKR